MNGPRAVLVLLLVLTSLIGQPMRAEDEAFERDVVLLSEREFEGSPLVYWISWQLLQEPGRETRGEVFLTSDHIEAIRNSVLERVLRSLDCKPAIAPIDMPAEESARPLLDLFVHNDLIVLAEVERLQPGWNVTRSRVETLVYARITEVVNDATERLLPGDLVTFLDPSGTITMGQTDECTLKPEGYYTPKKNDVLLLTGGLRDAGDPVPHLDACASCTFAVREGKAGLEILPNPPFGLRGEQLSLNELRAALGQQ